MNILTSLNKLGLDETEAKIYTYLLKNPLQGDTVFSIATATKFPRSTVYLSLDRLEEKNLISRYKKNNVLHFLAENPTRLKTDFNEKLTILDQIIPELLAMKDNKEYHSAVKTYTGDKGVRTVFEDIYDQPHLRGIKEFHTISNPKLKMHIPKYLPKVLEYKKSINIFTKLITLDEARESQHKEYKNDSHREVRFFPHNFSFDGTLIVYANKIALFSHKEDEIYSIIIESAPIAHMLDAIFLCIWHLLPQESK